MKGFQWWSPSWLMVALIGLVVVLGMLADYFLREGARPAPLQIPAVEQSSRTAPVRADGPLHEVSQPAQTEVVTQLRWVF
ncbi:hypothetical protein LF844_00430 [Metapseudomonas lalkuanensis]|uniref:hypothetical protein n=1 Tax=Metapseudomonas lalkuanensis TaxID=2604832 RepID=UPI001CF0F1F8|nr:hypothetical protein [Pseudomonas lalkuanensis]UCO98322.1 hypothetical protein LF844_00430 [Pseudomonas lalkuanensis]